MATPLAEQRTGHPAAARAQPYWNPYVAGFALGLVLLGGYLLLGRGLGATGAFSALAAWFASIVSPESAAANPVHARYLDHGPPLLDYVPILVLGTLIGGGLSAWLAGRARLDFEAGPGVGRGARFALAFGGGFLAALGAKIALGCTSGQALSGAAVLNAGSLVFMVAVFVAGYAVAFLFRKEWL
jgi:hypothetical protein